MKKKSFNINYTLVGIAISVLALAVICGGVAYKKIKNKNTVPEEPVYDEQYSGTTIAVYNHNLINSEGKIVDVRGTATSQIYPYGWWYSF